MTEYLNKNKNSLNNRPSQLLLEPLEDRIMLSSVEIFAAGQTGQEAFNLLIDGRVVETFERVGGDIDSRDFQRFSFDPGTPVRADQVSIEFINDNFDPRTGRDNNLLVDGISIDGQFFETEAPSTVSSGIFADGGLTGPGNFETELLNVNGTVSFADGSNSRVQTPVQAPRVQADPGTRIRVDAKGETGEEILQLQIDGRPVQDFTFDRAGQEQIFLFETDEVIDSSRVSFVFLNDAFDQRTGFDRNVDVSQFQVIDLGSDTREIFNVGTAEGALVRTGDTLNVANSGTVASSPPVSNPVVQDPRVQTPVQTPVVQAPRVQADPGTRIRVDAKGETGEEILQLQIDGRPVQDFTFDRAGQEQIFLFETDEVIDSSRVSFVFLNDAFDQRTGFDRNVDVSQFQVIDLGSDTREIFNVGTAEGALVRTGDTLNVANSGTVASSPPVSNPADQQVRVQTPVVQTPVVQADPGTRIRVDATGQTAEEILQLQVDGQPVQDFTFAAAGQEQILLFQTDEVIDSSRVSFVFLNDSFDPITGFDRNVDVRQFQVIDLGSDTREIFNIGTAEGSLAFTGSTLDVASSGTTAVVV